MNIMEHGAKVTRFGIVSTGLMLVVNGAESGEWGKIAGGVIAFVLGMAWSYMHDRKLIALDPTQE